MESFLDPVADSKDKMIYQAVSLEPTLKATPISQRSSGKIKATYMERKRKIFTFENTKITAEVSISLMNSVMICLNNIGTLPIYHCIIYGYSI